MTGIPGSGSTGGDLSIGPALEKLRRDNNLTDDVHDPSEDEPHIVGIPRKFQHPELSESEPPATR